MLGFDVFKTDGFGLQALSAAVLKRPYQPTVLADMKIFSEKGVPVTTISVEEKSGQLSLIQTSPRGAPSVQPVGRSLRTLRSFAAPHLVREATIYADEIQGVRVFGAVDGAAAELETVQAVVNERLDYLRRMHDVTVEYHRLGAIKGLILDADGTTLFNLYTEFNVAQQTQAMALNNAATDVRAKCVAIRRQIQLELGGFIFTDLIGLCSTTFFDALIGHATVVLSLQYQESASLREDLGRTGFRFGGILWKEYLGGVNKPDGSAQQQFIADDEAYVFPTGVMTEDGPLFRTFYSPADFMETANTIGLPLYVKPAMDPEGLNRFVKLHSQSNPLNLCLRPRAVVKATKI